MLLQFGVSHLLCSALLQCWLVDLIHAVLYGPAKHLILNQVLDMQNVSVSLVGDFDCLQEVEDLVLKYLGTIPPRASLLPAVGTLGEASGPPLPTTLSAKPENFVLALAREFPNVISFTKEPRVKWQHLSADEEQRAIVYMSFPVMNRWGHTKSFAPPDETLQPMTLAICLDPTTTQHRVKRHPLWKSRVANVLVEVCDPHYLLDQWLKLESIIDSALIRC